MGRPGDSTNASGSHRHGSGGEGVTSDSPGDASPSMFQNLHTDPALQALLAMMQRLEATQSAATALAATNQSQLYEQLRGLTTNFDTLSGRVKPLEGILYGQKVPSTPAATALPASAASYDELRIPPSKISFASPPPRAADSRRTPFRQFEIEQRAAAEIAAQGAALRAKLHASSAQEPKTALPTSTRFGEWEATKEFQRSPPIRPPDSKGGESPRTNSHDEKPIPPLSMADCQMVMCDMTPSSLEPFLGLIKNVIGTRNPACKRIFRASEEEHAVLLDDPVYARADEWGASSFLACVSRNPLHPHGVYFYTKLSRDPACVVSLRACFATIARALSRSALESLADIKTFEEKQYFRPCMPVVEARLAGQLFQADFAMLPEDKKWAPGAIQFALISKIPKTEVLAEQASIFTR